MRPLLAKRLLAATVLATVLAPVVLCYGAITSLPHQCCMKQDTALQEGGSSNGECCVVSAPAPNPAAVITSSDHGRAAPVAAIVSMPCASAIRRVSHADLSSDHSPPGMASKTSLRI